MKKWMLALWVTITGAIAQDSLDAYIQQALEYCPHFKVHDAQEKQFQARARLAAVPRPIWVEGAYQPLPIQTRVGPQLVSAGVMFQFPFPGTFKAWSDYYQTVARAHHWMKQDRAAWIRQQVRSLYYQLWFVRQMQAVIDSQIALLRSQAQWLQSVLAGETRTTDLFRIEAEIEQLQAQRAFWRGKDTALQIGFNVLLGRSDTLAPITMPQQIGLPPDTLTLLSEVSRHPRIEAVRMEYQALEDKKRAIQRKNMPTLGFGARYIWIGQGPDALMFPSVRLIIPFPSQTKYELLENQYEQEAVAAQMMLVEDDLVSALAQAWQSFQAARQAFEDYARAVEALQKSRALIWQWYLSGKRSLTDVLDVERQILTYQTMQWQAWNTAWQAYTQVLYYLNR